MARSKTAANLKKIRERYHREANRFDRLAQAESGYRRDYFEFAAEQSRARSKEFTVKNLKQKTDSKKDFNAAVRAGLKESGETLVSKNPPTARAADIILSSEAGKSAFYGGTVDIWRGRDNKDAAILDFFGKDNLWEVMVELEDVLGVSFLADEDTYTSRKLGIMVEVAMRMRG